MLKMKVRDAALLAIFPLVYVITIVKYFWSLPDPSDPLEYLGSVIWGSTVNYYPALDRINIISGLDLFYHLLPGPPYVTGPIYALTVTTLSIVVGQIWLYRKVGFAAALTWGVFANCSWFFLFFGSQIFPEPTLILYAELAVLCFLWSEDHGLSSWRMGLAGMFAAMACMSKATAVFLPVFLLWQLMRGSSLRQGLMKPAVRVYGAGLVAGVLLSLTIYAGLFGFASVVSTFQTFFGSQLHANYIGRGSYNNAVSYYDVITGRLFLPIFLGLLVCIGAYRDKQAMRLLRVAWCFVFSIYFIYLITNRGYTPIPNYIYPAFFFTALGLAAYLGGKLEPIASTQKLGLVCASLLALIVGLRLGIAHNPSEIFTPGYYANLSKWVRTFFNGGVFALMALLVAIEVRSTRLRAATLVVLTALWSAAYAGGINRHHFINVMIPTAEFYYANAGALNRPTAQKVDVWVDKWNKTENPERLLDVYRLFFDQKYDRTHGQTINDQQIHANIQFVKTASDLASAHGEQILTDQLDLVQRSLPGAKLADSFEWNGLKLFVLSR